MHRSYDNPSPEKDHPAAMPALVFNVADYQRFVCDSDLTEAQQRQLLETLWTIIVSFVDLGFGFHPVQQVRPGSPCGITLPEGADAMLDSKLTVSTDNTLTLAGRFAARAEEGEDS